MSNAEIRKAMIARRRALASGEIKRLSDAIVDRFFTLSGLLPMHLEGMKIALYQAMPFELKLSGVEKRVSASFLFPRIFDRAAGEIEFVEATTGQSEAWQDGPYGIQEPHPDLPAVDPLLIDLIFVPGVAFGLNGERVGMGGGYYDRFLARVPQAIKVGLAFDFQLLERLEQETWDQSVDWIVTESREWRNPAAQIWIQETKHG